MFFNRKLNTYLFKGIAINVSGNNLRYREYLGGKDLLDKEDNIKLILLEIKRIKQLKVIRTLENTMRELYTIEKGLKNKLNKVEVQEEKALKEIVNQLKILDEIDIDIRLLKPNGIKSPIETLAEIKSPFQIHSIKTTNRFEGM